MQHTNVKMIDSLQEKAVVISGGAAGAIKAVSAGAGILPEAVLHQLPHWLNYGIHCVIGGVITLSLNHVYRWLTNKNKGNGN